MMQSTSTFRIVQGPDTQIVFQGPVEPGCWVAVWRDGPLTQRGIDTLIEVLGLCRGAFPPGDGSDAESEHTPEPPGAARHSATEATEGTVDSVPQERADGD